MKFTKEEILNKALDALNLVKNQSPDFRKRQLTMIGHPKGFVDPDPMVSEPTERNCSNCNNPVTSTMVKDKIMEMAPLSVILCYRCMYLAIKQQKDKGEEPRMIQVPNDDPSYWKQ